MKKDHYIVSVNRVPGVTRARMAAFIQEAVSTWGGQLRPSILLHGFHSSEMETDPLGPPCPLGKRGAVVVITVSRTDNTL